MFISRVTQALDHQKVRYAIVGGYAVALHGAVRGTIDLDIVITLSEKDFLATEKALQSVGLVSRLPIDGISAFHFRDEYIRNRNLVAWSFYNPKSPVEVVDVIITHDLKRMKVKSIKVGTRRLQILSINDLIEMKRESARPQDLADIDALERLRK